jgi:hypothetical protein
MQQQAAQAQGHVLIKTPWTQGRHLSLANRRGYKKNKK